MSERARTQMFLAAVAVIAGVVALMLLVIPRNDPPGPRSPTTGPQAPRRAIIQGAPTAQAEPSATTTRSSSTTTAPAAEGDAAAPQADPRPTRRTRAAERDARAFVAAFLHYEVGDLSAPVKRAIRSRATEDLARTLLNDPPRVPAGDRAARGRLLAISGGQELDDGRVQTAASIRRGGQRSAMVLTLVARGGRWLVSQVG